MNSLNSPQLEFLNKRGEILLEHSNVREFFVGDVVEIVREPYRECPFYWIEEMNEYCGKVTRIISKRKTYDDGYLYNIEVDDSEFSWCGGCFLPPEESEEFDFDISDNEFDGLLTA